MCVQLGSRRGELWWAAASECVWREPALLVGEGVCWWWDAGCGVVWVVCVGYGEERAGEIGEGCGRGCQISRCF